MPWPQSLSASHVPKAVFIGFGTNIGTPGQRRRIIAMALTFINRLPTTQILAASSIYETPPWGNLDQASFYNGVLALSTALPPAALLKHLKNIESRLGRQNRERWGPREIDLDILTYGNLRMSSHRLTIPHKLMHERDFVMIPLRELTGRPGPHTIAHQTWKMPIKG